LPTGVAACASAQAIEVRGSHELVLLASFGGRQCHAAFPSIFHGLAREQSRKPDEFYKIIVDKTPGQTRCDLFSRRTRSGFDGWGNEAGKHILLPLFLMNLIYLITSVAQVVGA
jgi:N6-adenosine-specific RNA methylase IME4